VANRLSSPSTDFYASMGHVFCFRWLCAGPAAIFSSSAFDLDCRSSELRLSVGLRWSLILIETVVPSCFFCTIPRSSCTLLPRSSHASSYFCGAFCLGIKTFPFPLLYSFYGLRPFRSCRSFPPGFAFLGCALTSIVLFGR